ncbi:MAG TPA: ATP-binding protein [Steroidobacteraceae bacterium]|nr:ATP-binding protein [Steroidobacteraceae bacterium]
MSLHDFERLQQKLGAVANPVEFLVNLFAHSPVGFAVWTADGFPLLTNQAFIDIFTVEPPPEYNVLKDDLLEKSGFLIYFQRAFKGETVHVPTFWYDPRELKIINMVEGRRVAVSMTIFPLFRSTGEIEYVAATYKNETQLFTLNANLEQLVYERTVQLNAANRELEAFSYSVAHDLRAPLRHINGFVNVLLDEYQGVLDDKASDLLHRIQNNTLTMGQLIDALLSLAKVTRNEPQLSLVDLSALARLVAQQLRAAEPERVANVVIQENLQARMDPALAWILLENLIANAWKFTRNADATRIEIGVEKTNGETAFFVKDNGAGFDAAKVDSLFKPFSRLHSAQEFPGTGIGLATAHRIVDRHGGKIWGKGEAGNGATFYFTVHNAA